MGQSLTVVVFFGAAFPDPEVGPGPFPRLTKPALDAAGKDGSYRDDCAWVLGSYHPGFKGRLADVRSGVGDYVYSHLAIADSATESYDYGILHGVQTPSENVEAWTNTLRDALSHLEWEDEDGEIVAAPDVKIGWHVAACYW